MTPDDLDDMAALLGDPEVMRYYPRPKSRDEALAWIAWNQRLYREYGFGYGWSRCATAASSSATAA
jgi:RimJ/RimL family protein N-acetyltransferase